MGERESDAEKMAGLSFFSEFSGYDALKIFKQNGNELRNKNALKTYKRHLWSGIGHDCKKRNIYHRLIN